MLDPWKMLQIGKKNKCNYKQRNFSLINDDYRLIAYVIQRIHFEFRAKFIASHPFQHYLLCVNTFFYCHFLFFLTHADS